MLAGMWGVKLDSPFDPNRRNLSDAATKLFQHRTDKLVKGLDQDLLKKFIWPIARQNLVILRNIFVFSYF